MKKFHVFLAIIMCMFWAFDYILINRVLTYLKPFFCSSIRFAIVSLFCFLFCFRERIPYEHFFRLFILSVIYVVFSFGLSGVAIKLTNEPTILAFIFKCASITGVIVPAIYFKDRLSRMQLFGIAGSPVHAQHG